MIEDTLHNLASGSLTRGAREACADQLAAVGQVRVALGAIEELQASEMLQKYASHCAPSRSATSASLARSSFALPLCAVRVLALSVSGCRCACV